MELGGELFDKPAPYLSILRLGELDIGELANIRRVQRTGLKGGRRGNDRPA